MPPEFSVLDFVPLRVLARKLHVSDRTIRRWLKEDKLPQPIRIGRSPLWKSKEVDEWLVADSGLPPKQPPGSAAATAGGAA